MESNVCLGCRFGSVKVEILVPEKYTHERFVRETRDFASDIAVLTKQKPIHYSLRFDSENSSGLDFSFNCQCILNIKRKECSNFNLKEEKCKVKHLQYNKPMEIRC